MFDIHELSEQLKPAGLLVITDTILNRVNINWKQGRRTHIFIDEFHVVFGNEQGANFFRLRLAAIPEAGGRIPQPLPKTASIC